MHWSTHHLDPYPSPVWPTNIDTLRVDLRLSFAAFSISASQSQSNKSPLDCQTHSFSGPLVARDLSLAAATTTGESLPNYQPTMADRGFFGRARSAHTAQQQPQQNVSPDTQGEAGDQAHHASLHRSSTQQLPLLQSHSKPPRLAKISSYIGLGSLAKAQSPKATIYPELIMDRSESIKPGAAGYHVTSVDGGGPIGDWKPAPRDQDKYSFYNPDDLTWHNPSLRQMVETVLCTMMQNGSSAPIPRHLNGWIAGILEEASHQMRQLEYLRGQIEELKATREQEVIEFAKVTEEWSQREKGFKAEINRLEHIISDTQQGAESVMLARAGSVVDRNDSRAFRAKLNRLSRSEEG